VISPHGFDELVLSACHPLYSAEQRWIVYARLAAVETPQGSYMVDDTGAAEAA
jgi:sortase (surface protein transpeptidase)